MSKIRFPEDMPKAPSVADADKMMIADSVTNEAKHITFDQAKQYLTITSIEMQPVAPGALPAGPTGQERKMEVTAVGSWTYGGNTFTNADGFKTTLWWNGTTWSNAGSAKIKGEPGINGKTIENYSNALAYSVGSQVFFNDTEIYEATNITVAGESPSTTPSKWVLRFQGAEYYNEVKNFNSLSPGYDFDDEFTDTSKGWATMSGTAVPIDISAGTMKLTFTASQSQGVQALSSNILVGTQYPIEIRLRALGDLKRVTVGSTYGSTTSTAWQHITGLTSEWLVHKFNITPTSGTGGKIVIGIMNTLNVGGEIEVDYIRVGTAPYGALKLEAMQVLQKLNNENKADGGVDFRIWSKKQENAKNRVVDFGYSVLTANSSVAGITESGLIDIEGWQELIYTPILNTTAKKITLYNSSLAVVAELDQTTDSTVKSKIIKASDYPTAKYIKLFCQDSRRDIFTFAVSFSANNKWFTSEIDKIEWLKLNSYEVDVLDYNTYFTLDGYYRLDTGALQNTGTYKSTPKIELPIDWDSIIYDGIPSSGAGLVFFDADTTMIASNPNASATQIIQTVARRSDFGDVYSFGYSWNNTFNKELSFKILRKTYAYKSKKRYSQLREESSVSNIDIQNITTWNIANPSNQITELTVFSDIDIPSKPYARIPTCVVTNAGSYLVACEMRSQSDDKGQFDLLLKRKVGSGTFTSNVVYPYNATYGRPMNPSFVIDRSGTHGVVGRIYLFFGTIKDDAKYAAASTTAELDMFYITSDDDGATWSAPTSIKSAWNTADYIGALPAPSNGIQMTSDGTLVVPTMNVNGTNFWRSGLAYLKVGGAWTFSRKSTRHMDNESLVYEVEGKVLLNARVDAGSFGKRRVYEYDFANDKWKASEIDLTFKAYTNVQMSIQRAVISGTTVYIKSFLDTNDPSLGARKNTTIWVSTDAKKWIRCYVVNPNTSLGYGVVSYYNNKLISIYEASGYDIKFQDLTPILTKVAADATGNFTTEEKLNKLIYLQKGWTY